MMRWLGPAACLFTATFVYRASEDPSAMRSAARGFVASLNDDQAARARFAFHDAERRDWHYVPRDRHGLSIGALNDEQRKALRKLLRTALSQRGLETVDQIIELETVLRALESTPERPATWRDPERYFISIFGDLASPDPWSWRFEGHHVALNITEDATQVSVTPHFFGANPSRSKHGVTERAPLQREEELGRKLILSLSEAERSACIVSDSTPGDVVLSPGNSTPFDAREGLRAADLSDTSRQLLTDLLALYTSRFEGHALEHARGRIDEAGGELRFAWLGSLQPNQPHAYRLHSPKFAIEYDNTQNSGRHVHTLWRDFERDFGDPLREHLQKDH